MQAAPPDILITNYSMLNVMLLRGSRGADLRRRPRSGSPSDDDQRLHARPRRAAHVPRDAGHRDPLPAAQPARPPRHRRCSPRRSASWPPARPRAAIRDAFDRFIEGFFAQPRSRFSVLPGDPEHPRLRPSAAASRRGAARSRRARSSRRGTSPRLRPRLARGGTSRGRRRARRSACARPPRLMPRCCMRRPTAMAPGTRASGRSPCSAIGAALFPGLASDDDAPRRCAGSCMRWSCRMTRAAGARCARTTSSAASRGCGRAATRAARARCGLKARSGRSASCSATAPPLVRRMRQPRARAHVLPDLRRAVPRRLPRGGPGR